MEEDDELRLAAELPLLRFDELLTEELLLLEEELLRLADELLRLAEKLLTEALLLLEEELLRLDDALDDFDDDCDEVLREPLPLREALPLRDWASANPNVNEATIAATKTLRSTFFITSKF